ncbi:MAG: PHP domain-containing protein, partial [Rhodoblastus sp.]
MDICRDVGFVHLHVHSSYSLREGALTIAALVKHAKADDQPALAITDTNNLFGALEFSEKLAKEGVQPIVGVQIGVDFDDVATPTSGLQRPGGNGGLVLLARDEAGYQALMRLVSRAWLDSSADGVPRAHVAALAEDTAGLIALTGGPAGPLDTLLREGAFDLAARRLGRLREMFGDRLYIELQRHGDEAGRAAEPYLRDMAYRASLPLVATNEPYFAARSDFEAHDALLCISEGATLGEDDRRRLTPEHRFKTRAEMRTLFADLPEATDNSVAIALR